jgi:hypothetical protein
MKWGSTGGVASSSIPEGIVLRCPVASVTAIDAESFYGLNSYGVSFLKGDVLNPRGKRVRRERIGVDAQVLSGATWRVGRIVDREQQRQRHHERVPGTELRQPDGNDAGLCSGSGPATAGEPGLATGGVGGCPRFQVGSPKHCYCSSFATGIRLRAMRIVSSFASLAAGLLLLPDSASGQAFWPPRDPNRYVKEFFQNPTSDTSAIRHVPPRDSWSEDFEALI